MKSKTRLGNTIIKFIFPFFLSSMRAWSFIFLKQFKKQSIYSKIIMKNNEAMNAHLRKTGKLKMK